MRIFLVGGSVRDYLLEVESHDRDYLVVGATEAEFLANCPFDHTFTKVDKFPVYIDDLGGEWALARREKKTGLGYTGFEFEFGPEVSLEEDLRRRDFTINSMAINIFDDMSLETVNNDPFNGQSDLTNKILRHTSDAFVEDPVRVLRLARFRARLGPDWSVAPETVKLVSSMARSGVLNELVPERIWKEMSRALMEPHPRLFFDTLLECDVLHVLFPEVYKLGTALEPIRHHPEGNAYQHTMLVLTEAAKNNFDLETRVGCLVHDFGKALTPRDKLPKHYGHEVSGIAVVKSFCDRLAIPVKIRDNAMKITQFHMHMHKLDVLTPKTFVRMFESLDAYRNPSIIMLLEAVGICDARGRLGFSGIDVTPLDRIKKVFDLANGVKFGEIFPNGETNPEKIKAGIFNARIQTIKTSKETQ